MREKQGVNKKDNLSENGMDKGNKKSTCETLQAMFEGMIVSQPVDKLKTQVKGYSVTPITERMLKKHKLGDAMAEVCDINELENELRESLKKGLPVYGFFRKKQMWSCFIFEKEEIARDSLTPEPESGKDMLSIYKLRKYYIHPDVDNLTEDMMEAAHGNMYQKVIDVFGDDKSDGFLLKDKIYVCKRDKSTGAPLGIIIGVALGIVYGMLFDNLALGISIGFCFGISFSMIWGTSTHRYVQHGMAGDMKSKDADSITDGAGSEDADGITDGSKTSSGDSAADNESDNDTDE